MAVGGDGGNRLAATGRTGGGRHKRSTEGPLGDRFEVVASRAQGSVQAARVAHVPLGFRDFARFASQSAA